MYKTSWKKSLLFLFPVLFGFIGALHAETRMRQDNGVEWLGDFLTSHDDYFSFVEYPYIYVCDNYGVRLHEIVQDGATTIEFRDMLPGHAYNEGELFWVKDGMVVWGSEELNIAHREDNELIVDYQAFWSDRLSWGCDISDNNLLITNNGILDVSDPTAPYLWSNNITVSTSSIIVGDRLFKCSSVSTPPLIVYDISDPDNPVEVDGANGHFGTFDHLYRPQHINNTLAFFTMDGIEFVFLDDSLNIDHTQFWDYYAIYEPYPTFYPDGFCVLHDSLYVLFVYETNASFNRYPRVYLFDPDESEGDVDVMTVNLPGTWGRNHEYLGYGRGCHADGRWLFINQLGIVRLYSFYDITAPFYVYDSTDLYPAPGRTSAFRHVCLTDTLLVTETGDNVFSLMQLNTGGALQKLGFFEPSGREGTIHYGDIKDSTIVFSADRDAGRLFVFEIQADSTIEEQYTFMDGGDERGWILSLDRVSDQLLCAVNCNHDLRLYRLDETEAVPVYEDTVGTPLNAEWVGDSLFCVIGDGNLRIAWYRLQDDTSLVLIDSVGFGGAIPTYRQPFISGDRLAVGPFLFSIENNELTLLHRFEYGPRNVWQEAVDLDGDRLLIHVWREVGHSLAILDLSEGSYTDSVAFVMNGTRAAQLVGDTLWAWSDYALMKFLVTGDFVDVLDEPVPEPDNMTFQLQSVYPNPFNSDAHVLFTLPQAADAKVTVFNILGQHVATLLDQRMNAGEYHIIWNGATASGVAPSGVYFIRAECNRQVQVQKAMLIR